MSIKYNHLSDDELYLQLNKDNDHYYTVEIYNYILEKKFLKSFSCFFVGIVDTNIVINQDMNFQHFYELAAETLALNDCKFFVVDKARAQILLKAGHEFTYLLHLSDLETFNYLYEYSTEYQ